MTTDKIIRDEYKRHYPPPASEDRELYLEWLDSMHKFEFAWQACEQWHERQNMMDEDSLEQTKEEARLANGG